MSHFLTSSQIAIAMDRFHSPSPSLPCHICDGIARAYSFIRESTLYKCPRPSRFKASATTVPDVASSSLCPHYQLLLDNGALAIPDSTELDYLVRAPVCEAGDATFMHPVFTESTPNIRPPSTISHGRLLFRTSAPPHQEQEAESMHSHASEASFIDYPPNSRDIVDAFRSGLIDRPTFEAMLRIRAMDAQEQQGAPEATTPPAPRASLATSIASDSTRLALCKQLRRENEESTALSHSFSRACGVCLTERPRQRVVFTACGHTACRACAEELKTHADASRQSLACPTCRAPSEFVRLFEQLIA